MRKWRSSPRIFNSSSGYRCTVRVRDNHHRGVVCNAKQEFNGYHSCECLGSNENNTCIFSKENKTCLLKKIKLLGIWKLRRNHVPRVMEASRMSDLPAARYKSGEGWGALSYDTDGWRLPIACLCLREPISVQHIAISTPFSHSSYPFCTPLKYQCHAYGIWGISSDHLRH